MPIVIDRSHGNYAMVVRRRGKKVYAAVFEGSLSDKQIASRLWQGEAAFYPYDVKKHELQPWKVSKPLRIRR